MLRCMLVVVLMLGGLAAPCLAQSDQVVVRAWIGDEQDPNKVYSVNQQVMLYVDVATTRWFTGGTQLSHVDVPNLIAKQRSTLATNSTQNKSGQTWSHQRWEINLYPQATGTFDIPPIAVKVKVSLANGSNAEKTIYTAPVSFRAQLPSGALTSTDTTDSQGNANTWLAAPSVSAEQSFQASNEALHVGDSVTRTVTVKAQDSLSILIPTLLTRTEHQDRYQSYTAPPTLNDTQNRGDYLSVREEQVTYVLQRGGEAKFPDLKLTWWNTKTQTLEHITLSGQTFVVKHTLTSWLRAYAPWLIALAAVLAIAIAALLAIKRYYRHRPLPLGVQFRRALKAQQWGKARVMLYQKMRRLTGETTLRDYQIHNVCDGELILPEDGKPNAFWALWKRITARKSSWGSWQKPLGIEQKLGISEHQAFSKREPKNGA